LSHTILLGVHITAGTTGLLLGPLALGLVALSPGRLWWLGLVAVATEAAALAGWAVRRRHPSGWLGWHIRLMCGSYLSFVTAALAGWAVRRRHPSGWLGWHIRLMCGSYLSFVTAALVVNWASPLAWVLPTAVGTPLIIRAVERATHPSTRPSTPPPRLVRSEMSA